MPSAFAAAVRHLRSAVARPGRPWRAMVLLALGLAHPVRGQEPERPTWFRRIIGQDQGLPETQVNAVAQTPDGYLWLGTRRGLVRYDGLAFTSIASARLPSQWINSLNLDRRGRLWISTARGLVVREADTLRRIPETDIPGAEAWKVLEDRRGRIWVATEDGAYVGDGTDFQAVPGAEGRQYALLEDREGRVWIGGRRQLRVTRGDAVDTSLASPLGGASAFDLVDDGAGGMWVATREGITHVTLDAGGRPRADRSVATGGPAPAPVWSLARSPDGGLWLGTDGRGVLLWDGQALRTVNPTEGTAARQVLSTFVDALGRVWAGTGAGLEKYQRGAFLTYQADRGLPHESIWSIRGDRDGGLWVTAFDGGVYRFDGHRFHPAIPPSGPGTGSIATWPAAAGGIWASPGNRRVVRLDAGGVHDLTARLKLPAEDVIGFYEDPGQRLWIITGGGLYRSDGGGPAVAVNHDLGLEPDDVPRVVVRDSTGRLLVGRPGLTVIDSAGPRRFREADGLTDPDVWALHPQGANVWIGTSDSGLYVLRRNRIVHLGGLDPRLKYEVLGIAEDRDGYLWLASSYGLLRVPRRDLEALADGGRRSPALRSFDREDGLPTTELNGDIQSQLYRDARGRLWLPSYAGVVRLDPAMIAADTVAPQVHLEHVVLDGVEQAIGPGMTLHPHASRLEITFATTNALVPSRVRVEYRMDGVDTAWIDAGRRRTVSYGPLAGGSYRFRLRAANQDGHWTRAPVDLAFRIRFRLYESPLFLPAVVSLALLLLVLVSRARRRVLEERGRALEQTVAERTRDLELARETLEARVEQRTAQLAAELAERKRLEGQLVQAQKLEGLGRLAGGVAHEINNSMVGVLGYAELAEQQIAGHPEALDDLRQIRLAGERVARITRQLLSFARAQQATQATVRLPDVLQRLGDSMALLAGDRIRVELTLPGDLRPVRTDETQLEQVVINLVMNARDAMPEGGQLSLRARNVSLSSPRAVGATTLPPGEFVCLEVTDNGTGMTPEVRARIFEPFFTTKGVERGGGLGLAVCHGIVTNQGGAIEVESAPGAGTRMEVWLPVGTEPAGGRAAHAAGPPRGDEVILLVDDDPMVRRVATGSLESLGYQIVPADDGVMALQLLERRGAPVDLVLADVMMPRMGGLELARGLGARGSRIPVLFISGFIGGEAGMEEQLAAYGDVLAKPFTLEALARAVRRSLDRADRVAPTLPG
ncbi:MAG: two-component regulator propeller domain-containing protein [Gemmatimonadales bacterium]